MSPVINNVARSRPDRPRRMSTCVEIIQLFIIFPRLQRLRQLTSRLASNTSQIDDLKLPTYALYMILAYGVRTDHKSFLNLYPAYLFYANIP